MKPLLPFLLALPLYTAPLVVHYTPDHQIPYYTADDFTRYQSARMYQESYLPFLAALKTKTVVMSWDQPAVSLTASTAAVETSIPEPSTALPVALFMVLLASNLTRGSRKALKQKQ